MQYSKRHSAAAMLLAAGFLLSLSACDNGDNVLGVDAGRVQFVISSGAASMMADAAAPQLAQEPGALPDSPVTTDGHDGDGFRRFFQSGKVTFSSISARNLDGVLVNVEMDELPVTVDLEMLEGGKKVTLPEGNLPVGTYDQVVVVMTQVEVVTLDGTIINITPPGGGWTAIVPICPFSVEEGGSTAVALEFNLNRAFSWRDNRYHFQPGFTCGEG
jgi:hypothetical protein